MRTNVYIDGFNLYYGAVKGTPFKWLDIGKLCRLLLPSHTIRHIKYYTAIVSARPHDPDQPMRQQTYLRALRTLPEVSIIYGHFLSKPASMPLACPVPGSPNPVVVLKTEEKGSDVNLATDLLWDAVRDEYDIGVIVSNDSDLVAPVRIVRAELGKKVGIVNPHNRQFSYTLRQQADTHGLAGRLPVSPDANG